MLNHHQHVIPLQVIPNGLTIRPASSLNFIQSVRPRPNSPPTVQSHPYWVESTLSLLPPIPPSAKANSAQINQNPRTSLYRKAVHSYASNADIRHSSRSIRQRSSLVIDSEPQVNVKPLKRPQSVCTPLLSATGSREACSSPVNDFGSSVCCMLILCRCFDSSRISYLFCMEFDLLVFRTKYHFYFASCYVFLWMLSSLRPNIGLILD